MTQTRFDERPGDTGPSGTEPEQLSLLAARDLPARFRLDQRTRQRGLAHIAELRAILAAGNRAA